MMSVRTASILMAWAVLLGPAHAVSENPEDCQAFKLIPPDGVHRALSSVEISEAALDRIIAACAGPIRSSSEASAARIDALYTRAEAYRLKRDYAHAILDYSEVLRLTSKGAEEWQLHVRSNCFASRGQAYIGRNRYDQAIRDFTEALRLNDNNYDAFFGRASAYAKKGDHNRAIQDYAGAIRLRPENQFVVFIRGMEYVQTRDYDRAIQDFTETLRLDPKYARALVMRAVAYAKKGDCKRVEADRAAAKRLGNNDLAKVNLRC